MFRAMRRKRQQLSREEAEAILERGTSGVLAVAGDNGYPYAVPLSYVYQDGKLWFHCAKSGHKLDAVRREEKASFCVIDQDLVVPEDSYFCMGDNRRVSVDSRDPSVGFVSRDQLIGKVVLRLYPFNKIGLIKNPFDE